MCDDMDFDVGSDVSDSNFDSVDDVSLDFDDSGTEFEDVVTEDFSFDDIGDDSFDLDDSLSDIDVSVDFDDSFEIDDISDDFNIDSSEEIETLDFKDDIENLDIDNSIETLEIGDIDSSDGIGPLELEDCVEALEFDDSLDDIEALELDDSLNENDEDFSNFESAEELSLANYTDSDTDTDGVSDSIETLDLNDDLPDDMFEDTISEDNELDINDDNLESLESDLPDENTDEEMQEENINTYIDLDSETVDNDNYDEVLNSDMPIVDEYESEDYLENITNDTEELQGTNIEDELYEELSNELNNSEEEMSLESSEIAPMEDVPISQEYENNEFIDEMEDPYDTEEAFEELNDEDLEQALRDNAVDNALLTDAVYEDDSELNYITENNIPQMTDEELAEFVNWENQHENGNYDLIENIMNDDSLTDDQKEFLTQQLLDEIREGENEVHEYGQRVKGLTYDGRDIITKPNEFEYIVEQTEQIDDVFYGELTENDINAVFEGLESYDFQGVDCFENIERLDSSLESFTAENWEQLSLDERKEKMNDLADYIIDVTGLENPPRIEFYNNPQEGDYGGFDRMSNTLSINEYMLYQNDEAADTVAHELWHALQYQRASNPKTKLDYMYQENFIDYIRSEDDFEGYQSQILESEARAFAQQIKDRLHSINWRYFNE